MSSSTVPTSPVPARPGALVALLISVLGHPEVRALKQWPAWANRARRAGVPIMPGGDK